MNFLNKNGKKIDRKIRKAEQAHELYTKSIECLKEIYYEIYDKETVEILFEVIKEKGHPSEVVAITDFFEKYKSEQLDEFDIKKFKRLLDHYNDAFIDKRSKKGV